MKKLEESVTKTIKIIKEMILEGIHQMNVQGL